MILRCLLVLFIAAVSACGHRGGCNPASIDATPLLSATGCVNMADPARPAAGTLPYDINEPFWSDGAEKQRFLSLPRGGWVDIADDGDFIFPAGTVLIKNFRLDGHFFETRLFARVGAGTGADAWRGYSYLWNDAGTEAHLLPNAAEVPIAGQLWHFPSREECLQCHTEAAGFSLGLELAQLNRDYSHAGSPVNQLDYLRALGVLADIPPGLRRLQLASSRDPARDLNDRARAWLHGNCAHCHRPGGGTESTLDLRAGTAFADMNLCDARPLLGELGLPDARLLAPGDTARSVLWSRIHRQDNSHMPPWFFNKVIDAHGVRLIEEWIQSLPECGQAGNRTGLLTLGR